MEVSVRTIYRDIDTLCQAGFPLVAYQGTGGGFEVAEGYRLDRQTLTYDEFAAILTALKGMNRTFGDDRFDQTREKVIGLLAEREREEMLFWQERLVIDQSPWGSDEIIRGKMNLLRQALEQSRIVRFAYSSLSGSSGTREVEPMTLLAKGSAWYLYGYCTVREDYRLFRLSRMSELTMKERPFTRRDHPPFDTAEWDKIWDRSTRPVHLLLRIAPSMRTRAEESFGAERLRPQPDGYFLVEQTYPEDEWVYSFLLGFGDQLEVLAPERLRHLLRDRAEAIVRLYSDDRNPGDSPTE